MLFALLYLLLRRVVRLIAGSSNDLDGDIELAVLRHQLMVLKRHVGRPRLRRRDRCSWQRSAVFSPVLGGRRSWSVRRRSFGGTGTWCGGSGPSRGSPPAADPR